ncbi:MAG TPA: DUF4956 domain-containing protein [Spirochaetota bacterium]|nr:DUF4956 domain-containing protein [Spirochaetota bacterium]
MGYPIEKITSILLKGFGSQKMEDIGFFPFLLLLMLSLIAAMIISYLYLKFYKNRATGSQIHRAFPLLGISVTAIFICIQFSLPLSLGLLGALSIVRFRTPIKEPEEIGFIMVVISTSICCATFNILFLCLILLVTYIGLLILQKGPRFMKGRLNDGVIIITLPSDSFNEKAQNILTFLRNTLPAGKIESLIENRDETVVSYSFTRLDDEMIIRMKNEMNTISGKINANFFFNRIGDI